MRNFAHRQLWNEPDPHGSGEWWADPRHRGTLGAEHLRARRRSSPGDVTSQQKGDSSGNPKAYIEPEENKQNMWAYIEQNVLSVFFFEASGGLRRIPERFGDMERLSNPKLVNDYPADSTRERTVLIRLSQFQWGCSNWEWVTCFRLHFFYLVSGLCTWSY